MAAASTGSPPRRLATVLIAVVGLAALAGCLGSAGEGEAAPSCPEDLRVVESRAEVVHLAWNGSEGADTYHVYRAGEDDAQHVAEVEETRYVDRELDPGTSYTYEVTAANATGEASDCPTVEVAAIPAFDSALAVGLALVGGLALALGLSRSR